MDASRLRELLAYDPATGLFRWRVAPARQVKAGAVAGNVERSVDRFAAKIAVDGRQVWLGRHDTIEQAGAAYLAAKRELHEGCTV